ncbi:hypothetical protein KGO06_00120 [Patescibacteria group bacterium]|nr:hypothetical protein [Patescibacteria group bacterium]
MSDNRFERARGQRIGRGIKIGLAAAVAVDKSISVVTQKESILGTVINDISHRFHRSDDDDNDPTDASVGSGGGASASGAAENISEFVESALVVIAVLVLVHVLSSQLGRRHSDPLPA